FFPPALKLERERPAVSSAWYQQSLAPYLIASFDPSLETYCLPVAAGIARGEVASVELPDHLATAELVVVVHCHDAVPAALQLLERSSGEAVLDAHVPALHDTEARAVAGRLRALLVVRDAYHHLCVALWLHGAAHHAEAHHRPSVFRDKARNDGLVRALAGPNAV